jgi:hypothetical protein
VPQPALLANANAFASSGSLLNWLAPKESPKSELDSPTQIVLRAFRYAAIKHRQQTLADGVTPYFAHVVRVCWVLRDVFRINDTATIVASILHDVVEDTDTGIEEIEARFGKTIAQYVDLLPKMRPSPSDNENATTMRSCLMHQNPCRSQNLRISMTIFHGASAPQDCHRRSKMRGPWLPYSSRFSRADADGLQSVAYSNSFRKSNLPSLGGGRGESPNVIQSAKTGKTDALTNLSVY